MFIAIAMDIRKFENLEILVLFTISECNDQNQDIRLKS